MMFARAASGLRRAGLRYFAAAALAVPFAPRALCVGDAPARIELAEGEVAVKLLGAPSFSAVADEPGKRLDPGDQVRAHKGSRAHLALGMGAMVLLGPRSTLAFERGGGDTQVALLDGEALFALTRPLDRAWTFSVRTGSLMTTAAGDRLRTAQGPAFWMYSAPEHECRIAVISGSVRIRAEGRTVKVRAGRAVRVPWGRPPGEPKPAPLPPGFAQGFAIKGALSGAEEALGLKPR